MARIRTIKPEFWTDETMAEIPREIRLLFLGLLNHVDDRGRCLDNERLIKAAVFPLDDDLTPSVIRRWLDELSTRGRITLYGVSGKRYLEVSHFCKHQKIDRPSQTSMPGPEEADDQGKCNPIEPSTNTRRVVDEPSLLDLGIREVDQGREGNRAPAENSTSLLPAIVETHAVATAPAPRKRDPFFDALALACGIDLTAITGTQARTIGVAASEIRKIWGDRPIDELEAEVTFKRNAYVAIYTGGASLTPSALAKHWGALTEQAVQMANPAARRQFAQASRPDALSSRIQQIKDRR